MSARLSCGFSWDVPGPSAWLVDVDCRDVGDVREGTNGEFVTY